ncbi:hypothetical protein GCM10010174_70280 [Kutzneria viridogrisea]|uniref:Uncharacterized protein n=1 Tax=Kutzneria viridogrisea TaxID=47990 RepID=A0ABR6BBN2_9PSEU|nr:hypothetical protein [Kutzneria viridogrisea]
MAYAVDRVEATVSTTAGGYRVVQALPPDPAGNRAQRRAARRRQGKRSRNTGQARNDTSSNESA